jgi:uncharacterized protein (DUF1015 family)
MASQSDSDIPVPPGLVLRPFRALRYACDAGALANVTSPPYDVIDDREHAELMARDPHNVVRLILPRDGADGTSRYELAARLLAQWRSDGTLVRDPESALYVYEETVAGHVQRGLVGAVALARADAQIVLPHEDTMTGPVSDRLALSEATQANLEPIFLVYAGGGAASELVASIDQRPPIIETTTDDGIRHRIWAITDRDELAAIAADLVPRRATIADGHHRYANYLQYQQNRRAEGAGAGPWDFGLTLLVDTSVFGPEVHPIHRVIPSLPAARAAEMAASAFRVTATEARGQELLDVLAKAGEDGPAFALADTAGAWLLTRPDPEQAKRALPADRSPAWRSLDVSLAHYLLIRQAWGLQDTEAVVGFRHDLQSTLEAAGASGTALLLNPTPVQGVAAVAEAGDRMPRKSTLFTPKPRTGLVIRLLDAMDVDTQD